MRLRVALLMILMVLTACGGTSNYTFHGGVLDPPRHAPEIAMSDQNGKLWKLSEQGGNVVMLYFGYSNCPDLCPTTLSSMKGVKQQLGNDAQHVRFVMVTVDPARDTPPVLGQYLANFDPAFVGLVPSPPALDAVKQNYDIQTESSLPGGGMPMPMPMTTAAPAAATTPGSYEVGHTSVLYVIDRSNQLRLAFPTGFGVDEMTQDVRYLVHNR